MNPGELTRFSPDGGGSLRYEVAGDGDPVVLLHGFGLDADMWNAQWPAFAARHRVIRYDLRGYGHSSLPDGPYSHVDDLLGLLALLRARPAHLVGLSMGGRIALRVAAQEPAAVRSLTLVDPALDGHAWGDEWSARWREMKEVASRGDVEAAKDLWLQHDLFGPTRRRAGTAGMLKTMIQRYSGWHLWNKDPGTGSAPPVADRLATISTPTLVIVGALDLPDFQAIARRLSTGMPNATLRTIEDCGHMANIEAPDIFNDLVLAHLDRWRSR